MRYFVRNGLIKVALVARLRPVARLLGLREPGRLALLTVAARAR